MKCPVCKIDLDLADQGLDELYCDCSHCGSSLLFRGKECEVLSEGEESPPISGQSPQESAEKSAPEELAQEEGENKEMAALPEESQGQYPSQPQKEEEGDSPEALSEEGDSPEALSEEGDSPEALSEEGDSPEAEEPLSAPRAEEAPAEVEEEGAPEEEEFVPEEGTGVPEMGAPEEGAAKEPSEGPDLELSEKSAEGEEPEDFQFEEEAQDPPDQDPPDQEPPADEKAQAEDPEKSPGDPKKEDFSEVAEFGASQNQDKQGPYIYELTLSEINSRDLREKTLSVLEDEQLGLDFGEKGPSIKEGKITVSKISPVQAYTIAISLMGLPLDISWEQRHIADSPPGK